MAKNYEWRFEVTGHGDFPVDMLRYDRCTPRGEEDSGRIADTLKLDRSRPKELPTIQLVSTLHRPPTEGRWKSFGWHITKAEKVQA